MDYIFCLIAFYCLVFGPHLAVLKGFLLTLHSESTPSGAQGTGTLWDADYQKLVGHMQGKCPTPYTVSAASLNYIFKRT